MSDELAPIPLMLINPTPLPEWTHFLTAANFSVEQLTSLPEAARALQVPNAAYEAVLLSINWNDDAAATDFLEWLKITHPQITVLAIGKVTSEALLIACLNKGAADFCATETPPEEMLSALRLGMRKQRGITENMGDISASVPVADWVELVAQTETEYLGRIQRFSDILFRHRLPPQVVDDLRMALEEFGRNAIEWGNRYDRNKKFSIRYAFIGEELILVIEDEGEGFDWQKGMDYDPSKDPIGHLKNRMQNGKRPGGFGIFMMNKIMDEVFYNAKGNVCVMKKRVAMSNHNR